MKGARTFGGERRNAFIQKVPTLLPVIVFLVVLAAPALAQGPPPPPYVNVGPGPSQAYWTNQATFQANWGPSPGATNYQYGLNQNPTSNAGTVPVGVATPSTSVTFALPVTILNGQT